MKYKFSIIFLLLFAFVVSAQEKLDLQTIQKIRDEGLKNSKVMDYLEWVSDYLAPRLAMSPAYKEATKWAIKELNAIGLENVTLDPSGSNGRGLVTEKAYGAMTAPQYMQLFLSPKAWTGSTDGLIKGNVIWLDIKTEADLEKYKGKLKGAIVLNGAERILQEHFTPDAKRYTDAELEDLKKPVPPRNPQQQPGQQPQQNQQQAQQQVQQNQQQGQPQNAQPQPQRPGRNPLLGKITQLLKDEGVALVIEPSTLDYGTIGTGSGGSRKACDPEGFASIVVSVEQYNRMVRLLGKNVPVSVEAEIKNKFFEADTIGYNVIGEIPGSDPTLKDEIVMLGGHLDCWHGATGASDNGAGVAVCMEAVRILKALNLHPKRTIKIGLWDSEELGLVGSRGYVSAHLYDRAANKPKPDYDKFYVYFNYDNGAGKIRGIYTQGNEDAKPIFEEWLKPLNDLGATTVTTRNTGGTDHQSFDGVGLPGFQFIQDPLAYMARIHHTTMDTFDHAPKDDLTQSATIMAIFIYNAAMRDGKFPRKPFDPTKQPQRGPGN